MMVFNEEVSIIILRDMLRSFQFFSTKRNFVSSAENCNVSAELPNECCLISHNFQLNLKIY